MSENNMSKIALVDDDIGVLDAVGKLLRSYGYAVVCHENAEQFLASPFEPGCVVSDLRMPRINGLELLNAMRDRNDPRAVILLTAHGDVDLAVRALKSGAFDFIEKPLDEERLLSSVSDAMVAGKKLARENDELNELQRRYQTLSRRQKEVLWLVTSGCANKEIAARLEISIRTVETYRAWVLERMHANSLADLVKIAHKLELAGLADSEQRTVGC